MYIRAMIKFMVHVHENVKRFLIDEIRQYQAARWVVAPEAVWHLYEFNLNETFPTVINL